ncbi:LysM domain-containing protein [Mycena venus]|uniref:LysM domain-containing protein n=1 Tax=Mycena venus TaxID=2733690 RepID=A0A8H6WXU5_9AGAR|nr:LysM domain-containing protein [Mycena venus]
MTINSALCLACSSSLPPKSTKTLFTTQCCDQPICHACIQANPRLARYNPCLACLGGVGVVGAGQSASSSSTKQPVPSARNVDGAVRDEDTFAIGDDEDDDSELPQYSLEPPAAPVESSPTVQTSPAPTQYYIKPNDTLQGIALRFKVAGQTLCRLNNLPPSTLTTTPHLLHTRTSLVLPPSALAKLHASDAAPSPAEAHALEVSRAGKRLQTLTKETDWHVARAYVALAEDPDESAQFALKQKELGAKATAAASSLEAVAADRYLDDLEWEAEQLRAGRAPRIEPYPVETAPLTGKNGKPLRAEKGLR